jgi:hypothetical protein
MMVMLHCGIEFRRIFAAKAMVCAVFALTSGAKASLLFGTPGDSCHGQDIKSLHNCKGF